MHPAWLLLPLVFLGCGMPDPGHTRIIGHGGLGSHAAAPINARAAVEGALAMGLHGVELDVQLTADSVLVAYHEQHLEELTACHGLVNALTWEELRHCAVTGRDGTAHPIERLDSLLPRLARAYPDADFTLDCKLFAAGDWWPYLHAYANALVALDAIPLDERPTGRHLHGRLLVECQVHDFLLLLQTKQPWIPLFLYGSDAEEATWRATTSRFAGITLRNDRINAEEVAFAQGLGLEVAVYGTGGRRGNRKALNKGVDRIQTDKPGLYAR
jgi:glycerophosphoryl diester phosphodiesterase